jgi:CubicO group peptidase (beta-lactamase class C family)
MKIHKITALLFIFLCFIYSKEINAQQNQNITGIIDSIMKANYPEENPGASLIVMKDHELLFKAGYGKADLENPSQKSVSNTSITSDTKFRIGSITKQFTAISILMMLSENKLSLDDLVSQYYPDIFDNERPVSIRHLLSHTSGIKDLSEIKAVRQYMFTPVAPYDLIKIISEEELNFEPGSTFEYSNSGYVILGGILEQVSGLSYKEFLQERIFDPLGMHHSHYANSSEISGDLALGYFTRADTFVDAPDISSSLLFAAGGIWSTVSDMALWNEALYGNKLVDQKIIQMAFTPNKLNSGKATDYGFGFRSCQVNDIASIEHGGGVFGYSCYGIRIKSEGVYVLILSNFERENNYDDLVPIIAAITIEKPYVDLVEEEMNEEMAKPYLGKYLSAHGDTLSIFWNNNKLIILQNEKEKTLKPLDTDLFRIEGSVDDRIKFNILASNFILKRRRSMGVKASRI